MKYFVPHCHSFQVSFLEITSLFGSIWEWKLDDIQAKKFYHLLKSGLVPVLWLCLHVNHVVEQGDLLRIWFPSPFFITLLQVVYLIVFMTALKHTRTLDFGSSGLTWKNGRTGKRSSLWQRYGRFTFNPRSHCFEVFVCTNVCRAQEVHSQMHCVRDHGLETSTSSCFTTTDDARVVFPRRRRGRNFGRRATAASFRISMFVARFCVSCLFAQPEHFLRTTVNSPMAMLWNIAKGLFFSLPRIRIQGKTFLVCKKKRKTTMPSVTCVGPISAVDHSEPACRKCF